MNVDVAKKHDNEVKTRVMEEEGEVAETRDRGMGEVRKRNAHSTRRHDLTAGPEEVKHASSLAVKLGMVLPATPGFLASAVDPSQGGWGWSFA